MAITAAPGISRPGRPAPLTHGLAVPRRGIGAWLTTTDHKRIGIMYMVSTLIFFVIGGIAALLVRTQLALPEASPFNNETYNEIFTIHASVMLFLFVIPFGV